MTFPDCPVCGSKMPVTSWKYCERIACTRLVQWARRALRRRTATPAEKARARRLVRKVDGE